jgi:nucleoid DNA-binding protein
MAPMKAMKTMKANNAMKAMKATSSMTASQAYSAVAEKSGLKAKDVKGVMEGIMALAAEELKKNGSFKLGGALNLKLKKKPAKPARKGINPFSKLPCVFKAKPASKTVKVFAMKKLKEMIN